MAKSVVFVEEYILHVSFDSVITISPILFPFSLYQSNKQISNMKKITTLVFACLLGAVAYGQGISGGVKAGLNLANQTFSGNGYTTSPSFLPGFHAGVYATMMFGERFGLQPEILYSGQGAKSGDQKYKVNYVNIPVLARFNVNKVLSFHAGPQFGVLTSAKFTSGSSEQDMKDQVKGTDMGIAAGMGIDLPMKLNFGVRFVQGLSNISDVDSSIKQKNYNLQLSVGYKLFGE